MLQIALVKSGSQELIVGLKVDTFHPIPHKGESVVVQDRYYIVEKVTHIYIGKDSKDLIIQLEVTTL